MRVWYVCMYNWCIKGMTINEYAVYLYRENIMKFRELCQCFKGLNIGLTHVEVVVI